MAKKDNYLDFVPRHSKVMPWEEDENGDVQIRRENLGFFNKIAQVVAKKPRFSYIELDDFGSFVWKQIDGKRTIYEIGQLVHDEFGDKAEPLYNRLVGFIRTLHENRFVVYENKIKKD